MNLKPVVKLMNFHALLRVDNAKKRADRHLALEAGITDLLDIVMNNRNFLLDKQLLKPDATKPPLHVYLGSDYGFCGAFNHRVDQALREDPESQKIVIGRKLMGMQEAKTALFSCERNEYESHGEEVQRMLVEQIARRRCSSIDIVYNRYVNASTMELVTQNIFPLTNEKARTDHFSDARYRDDFVVEGDINTLLVSLVVTYIDYELRIALDSSYASENIMRQEVTTRSLDKIDELEQIQISQERKEQHRKEFLKVLDSYSSRGNIQ